MHRPDDMRQSSSIRYLSADLLQSLQLAPQEIALSIEHLLLGRQRQQVWNAPKAVITPPDGRYMMATLAAADDPPFLVVKALVLNPDNLKRGLPSINALVTMLDSRSGLPLAVIDGNWVTAVRTAGLSAVAACRCTVICGLLLHCFHLSGFMPLGAERSAAMPFAAARRKWGWRRWRVKLHRKRFAMRI